MSDPIEPPSAPSPSILPASLRTPPPTFDLPPAEKSGAVEAPTIVTGPAGRRISRNAWALLAAFLAAGAALAVIPGPPGVLTFMFVPLGWFLSLIAHEYGHAIVAYWGGDTTVPGRGYLTLDPRRYVNNVTTLLLPLIAMAMGGIALPGGAVLLRLDLMRSPAWRSASSAAGPLGTLLVLLLLTGVLVALNLAGLGGGALAAAVCFLIFLQATALILNLLPVPGLDGYGVLQPFLPRSMVRNLRPVEGLAIIGLFVAIMWIPEVGGLLFRCAFWLISALGVSRDQFIAGYDAFRFWAPAGQ